MSQSRSASPWTRSKTWRPALIALFGGASLLANAADQPAVVAAPLAARAGPRGGTLFARVAPEQSGIVVENKYDDPRMWGNRYSEFVYGAIGTGVAIADYDGDGLPDIFILSKTEGGRLFRNLGNWKFKDVTSRAGVSGVDSGWMDKAKSWVPFTGEPEKPWFTGAAFADVDNDGRLDLYVCRFGQPNLLFMNRGNGTFTEEAQARGLALSDASGTGAFCDYDHDGWLDVYVQTNLLDVAKNPVGQRDHLFHNNGNGTFTDVTERAGVGGDTQGHSATWWDFDNDGWPDLYVANDFAPADMLYRNNHNGTFTNVLDRFVPHTPHSSMGADLGDVNNDGRIDFLVADMAATTHERDQRGMATNRSRLDEMKELPGTAQQYMRNTLLLNTGIGRLMEGAYLAGLDASDWTWSVRLEDLDNDGRLDAFFTNGMVRELNNVDLVARTTAAESVAERVRIMKGSPPLSQPNLAFRNLGDLYFENESAAWGLDQRGVSFGAAFGDLDGDGDLDLVYVNYEGAPAVLRNDSDSGHRLVVALRGTKSNRFGVGATIRIETASGVQVRQLVVSRGYLSSSEPVLHFGLGDDAQVSRLIVKWPSGAIQSLINVAADQKLMITEPSGFTPPPSEAVRLPMFSPTEVPKGMTAPQSAGAGVVTLSCDVDGDGRADQVTATDWGPVKYLHAGATGLVDRSEAGGFTAAGNGRWRSLAAADFNGDGKPDVVAGNLGLNTRYHANADEPALRYVGDFGAGREFAIEACYENGKIYPWLSRGELAVGVPDVRRRFQRNDAYARATLSEIVGEERLATATKFTATELRSGVFVSEPDGRHEFVPLPRIAQISPINGIVAGDFDGDGNADIYAVQNTTGAPASIGNDDGGLSQLLLGDGHGNFRAVPPAESGLVVPGAAISVEARDIDGDGRTDFLITLADGRVVAFRNNGTQGNFVPPGGAR